ncbi:putative uncharacterized protein DDB_G0277255 [Leptopilina heterotoma]|uniref:putative uncharacterized protein DDB_G0277255 n=1 Tax=Leptopilina heterotoma TaxID=63436 RepID=UPI001CA8B47B|nr:putative uncharacterized protein DDB_G0277255 [Leptopilina heterotoma]
MEHVNHNECESDDSNMSVEYLDENLEFDDIEKYENSAPNANNYPNQNTESQGIVSTLTNNDLLSLAKMVSRVSESYKSKSNQSVNEEQSSNNPSTSYKLPQVSLKQTVELIPEFDGESSALQTFISECQQAFDNTRPENQPILLKYIKRKLKGKAQEFMAHSSAISLKQFLSELEKGFSIADDYSTIFVDVANLRQSDDESMISYVAKARKLLFKLTELARKDYPTLNNNVKILEHDQYVTKSFCGGLLPQIEIRVNLRYPTSLQQAAEFALQAEHHLNKFGKRSADSQQQCANGSKKDEPEAKKVKQVNNIDKKGKNLTCYVCGKKGHISRNCWHRASSESDDSNKNDENNDRQKDNNNKDNRQTDNKEKNNKDKHNNHSNKGNGKRNRDKCNYCNKIGHTQQFCIQRRVDELEKNRSVCPLSKNLLTEYYPDSKI